MTPRDLLTCVCSLLMDALRVAFECTLLRSAHGARALVKYLSRRARRVHGRVARAMRAIAAPTVVHV